MTDRKHAEDLSPADLAQLDQNWSIANQAVDDLLTMIRRHREEESCTTWYCCDNRYVDVLAAYRINEFAVMLRVALDRLASQSP